MSVRFDPIDERHEFAESANIRPNFRIVGVEDVRAVFVNQNAGGGISLGEAIPPNVISLVENEDVAVAQFDQFPRKNGPGQPGSGDRISWHRLMMAED